MGYCPTRRAVLMAGAIALAINLHDAEAAHRGSSIQGSVTTLSPWTITNNVAGGQVNVPISVPVPLAAGVMTANDSIRILDSDGATILPCQEDNRCSNYAGTDVRMISSVTVILPTLNGSEKRQLTVQKLSGVSPASGTDVSVAEALATSFNTTLSMVYKDGNTYTADAASGLSASPWTSKTAPANDGKWQTGGGFVTSWKVFCPFSRSGGTLFTTNNLGAHFIISVFKAQRGAVGAGNPIIAISTKYWINCGYIQITPNTAVSHWFDLTVTSGTNTQSWVGSSPAKTLTLSGAGSVGTFQTVTATVPAGGTTFSQSSVGQVITDNATGSGLIVQYISATQVSLTISTPFTGTAIASGNWRMWGLNHQYASDFPQQEIWYGGALAITTQPDILSHLGTAWNGTAGGPMSYFISTNTILPFSTPVAQITNSLTNVNASGPSPVGFAPSTTADMTLYIPTTGGREEIAPVPGFQVGGLIKFDAAGWTRIFANASKLATLDVQYRDQNTGKCGVPFNNGLNYVYNPDLGTPPLPRTNYYYHGTSQITFWTAQVAHHPNCYYVPWLLSGDYYWAEKTQAQLFWLWTEANGFFGTGFNRLFCTADEPRGNGWNFRDIILAMFMTPDRNPSMLGYTRANIKTLYDNQFIAVGSGVVGTPPYPGLNASCINNTGPGKCFATSGYRTIKNQVTSTPAGGRQALWQLGYGITGFFLGKGIGMVSPYADTFMTWAMEGITGPTTNQASVVPNWLGSVYYYDLQEPNNGAFVNDWANVYRVTANDLSESGLNRRLVTGTGISLSALSGNAITVNMPAGYFTNGGTAFYANGMVRDYNAASLQITPLAANSQAGSDPYSFSVNVGTASGNKALPSNAGTVKVWNTGTKNIYIKLSIGPGAATTGDQLITPGNYGKATVGTNTYLNYIAAAGAGVPVGVVFGSRGIGYAINDNITTTIPELSGKFTTTTAAVLTVTDVGAAGDVVGVSVSNPGLYIALFLEAWATTGSGTTVTQASTSGGGSGFTYRAAAPDLQETSAVRYGTGFITAVNTGTNVVTLDTTTSMIDCQDGVKYGYPFAQTTLVTNTILAPAPYPGDNNGIAGIGGNVAMPVPHSSQNEYWTIQKNCNKLANLYGYANAAAANSYLATAYTGIEELKWRMVN